MNDTDTKRSITAALSAFSSLHLRQAATGLLNALGYRSNLMLELSGNGKDDFLEAFNQEGSFRREKALWDEWTEIRLLFQLTADHISDQHSLFTNQSVEKGNQFSYLFFAVGLSGSSYPRGKVAQITREINKLTKQPALIVFKHGDALTLAVIDRRLHKKDESKDVLKKVTLIKDINIVQPHRAHLEILFDLSLPKLATKHQPLTTFAELHDAWRSTLNISELNKKFYRRIADWFYWAVANVQYPLAPGIKDQQESDSINVIRLLTRIIFVWFLREKRLVPDDLFEEKKLEGILKESDLGSAKKSNYYRGVLQNLFFATLNQKMNSPKEPKNREWVSEKHGPKNQSEDFTIVNKYRFPELFKNPDEFLQLVSTIPFLNGGLFDCLDKGNENKYVDGFTRRDRYQPDVPNMLFFGDERTVDLSKIFEDKKRSKEPVKGLIHILNDYKFTIAENTPIEEEVALDPELLGRVFENLLAAYNPETGTTARKTTGSFYTPREIVNYMVDESLLAHLKTWMLQENPASLELGTDQTSVFGNEERKGQLKFERKVEPNRWSGNEEELEKQLRILLSYSEEETSLTQGEKEALIEAIHSMNVLDPACGSGAFPMGVLLKAVHVLHKLDKDNATWKELQRRKAIQETEETFKIGSKEERETRLLEINEVFDTRTNFPDYARKLFLIQNCIFGVDIQPIAVQISKLRFFISLLVDQKHNDAKENRGVLSLPNLETKFVAANTLIGIEQRIQSTMVNADVQALEHKLNGVRKGMFSARSYREKKELQALDKKLRNELAELIRRKALEAQKVIEKQIAESAENKKGYEKKRDDPKLVPGQRKQYDESIKRAEREIEEKQAKLLDTNLVEANARRLAEWDPYDQNAHAEFFDRAWMFGMSDGFDIVLGNPPYVRQEELKEMKPLLASQFECYTGTSDLYVYFWEKGVKLLKSDGTITYISSNKFFRAGYGEKLRRFLTKQTVLRTLIDFGDRPVFEATTYPCVLVASRSRSAKPEDNLVRARTIETHDELERFEEVVQTSSITMRQTDLGAEGWRIQDRQVLGLLEKITKGGVKLNEYVGGKIYRGITTGFNEAFVIDEATKNRLIKEDKKSAEVIKPFLRGRDIKRYAIADPNLFLVYVPCGWTDKNRKRMEPEKYFNLVLPAIHEHLEQYETQLKKRDDQGDYWWEMRPCKYLKEFEEPNILLQGLMIQPTFVLNSGLYYLNAPANFLASDNSYLLGLLNSGLLWFFHKNLTISVQQGFLRIYVYNLERLPIASPTESQRRGIEERVEKILAAKKNDGKADTSALEKEIDRIVYELYGLTEEEIAIVEGKMMHV